MATIFAILFGLMFGLNLHKALADSEDWHAWVTTCLAFFGIIVNCVGVSIA